MRCVQLQPGIDGRQRACLRPLNGADELAAEYGPAALLSRLLILAGTDTVAPKDAARLAVCDRDRMLAAIQRDTFGDRIDADAECADCGKAFALEFSLAALTDAQVGEAPDGVSGPAADGSYTLGRIRFRLPCSQDLDAIAGLSAETARLALLEACILEGDAGALAEEIEAAMERLSPTLDTDLDATCPHCGEAQRVRFSIVDFLQKQFANERRFLIREVHEIASAYGWSYDTIMALPRRERHSFVRLIVERAADGRDWQPVAALS